MSLLYEGTNEIQAIDLLLRKVIADKGSRARRRSSGIFAPSPANLGTSNLNCGTLTTRSNSLCIGVEQLTARIIRESVTDAELPHRVADDYLGMIGWLLLVYAWARTLRLAAHASGRDPFYAEKSVTGHQFFAYRIAEFAHRKRLVEAGCRTALPSVSHTFAAQ